MRRNVLYQYMYVLIKNIRAFNLTLSGQAPRPGGTRLRDIYFYNDNLLIFCYPLK